MSLTSMTSSHDRSMVPLFDGKNWPVWKVRMHAYLQVQGLADTIVAPSRARAPGTSTSSTTTSMAGAGVKMELADASKDERNAYSIIMLRLDDERMMMMQSIATGDAAGLWANLTRLYERTTTASRAHTRRALHRSKMGDDDFDVYRSRVMQLVMRLRGMGEQVTDSELIYVVLEGLPPAYSQLVQSLEVQDDLKFDKLCDHVRDHQEKIGHATSTRTHLEDAMAAYTFVGRRDGVKDQRPESEHRCRLCKKMGHWEQHCTLRRGRTADDCYRCGGKGHQMRDCTLRSDNDTEVKHANFSVEHCESAWTEEWSDQEAAAH